MHCVNFKIEHNVDDYMFTSSISPFTMLHLVMAKGGLFCSTVYSTSSCYMSQSM